MPPTGGATATSSKKSPFTTTNNIMPHIGIVFSVLCRVVLITLPIDYYVIHWEQFNFINKNIFF